MSKESWEFLLSWICLLHFLIRSVIVQHPKLLFTALLSQFVYSLEQEPTLECFADGLRLYFKLDEPFYGHIYVKECFMKKNCHFDYTWNPAFSPFYFNVFYNSDCRVNYKIESQGVSYSVVVIVQHQKLFLTKTYRTYKVVCFYPNVFYSSTEISNLKMTKLEGGMMANCTYEVLMNSVHGKPVKHANIGDRLVHKWSCESEVYGMLIHSCFVHGSDNASFQLVDQQGCITDQALMDPLDYNDNLKVAYSVVPAFQFADQLNLHFQCKLKLCIKAQNGCKGISPPKCGNFANSESSEVVPDILDKKNVRKRRSVTLPSLLSPCYVVSDPKICKNTVDANALNILTISKMERINNTQNGFLNISKSVMNPFSLKFLREENSTHLTFDANTDQLMISDRNQINQTDFTEISLISCVVLRNRIFSRTVFFAVLVILLLIIIMLKFNYNKLLVRCHIVSSSKRYCRQY